MPIEHSTESEAAVVDLENYTDVAEFQAALRRDLHVRLNDLAARGSCLTILEAEELQNLQRTLEPENHPELMTMYDARFKH